MSKTTGKKLGIFKMPKMNFPKFGKKSYTKSKKKKPSRQSVGNFFIMSLRYIVLVAITVFTASVVFISLPYTEKVWPNVSFDFQEKQYWEKTYTLELLVKTEDEAKVDRKIEETKSIIQKRLYAAGVEEAYIAGAHLENPTADNDEYFFRYINVWVKSSLDETEVDEIVRTRNYIRFYIPKEDVDFDDEENPIAQYLIENYTPTDVTRHDFRNIAIKELTDSEGEGTYFAIFKPKFFSDFTKLAEENAGNTIGIGFDRGVSQVLIPYEFSPDYNPAASQGGSGSPELTFGLTRDERQAELAEIQFNSGVIPLEYSVIDQEYVAKEESNDPQVWFSITIIVAMALFAAYGYFRENDTLETVFTSFFEIGLVLSAWFAYHKFFFIDIDVMMMLLEGAVVLILAHDYLLKTEARTSRSIILFAGVAIIAFFGFGQLRIFGLDMLALMIGLSISEYISKYYITNMKAYLLND